MLDWLFKKGQDDARNNKGAQNKFDSSQQRESYEAGRAQQPREQQQRQQPNKR